MVTAQQITAFREQGYLVCRGLLDVDATITPLRRDIQRLVRHVAAGHGVTLTPRPEDGAAFDDDYQELVATRPELHPIVYDAVKMLLPFVALTTHQRIVDVFKQLYDTDFVGWPAGGVGTRIDRPHAETYLLPWHQDFPYQLRSTRGATFWVPLVPIDAEIGRLGLCSGSHAVGPTPLVDVGSGDRGRFDRGDYSELQMEGRDAHVAAYVEREPDVTVGDVLAFDSMTLHRSGFNHSERTRWSCQVRLFSFDDDFGRQTGWQGSFKAGKTVPEINSAVAAARATLS